MQKMPPEPFQCQSTFHCSIILFGSVSLISESQAFSTFTRERNTNPFFPLSIVALDASTLDKSSSEAFFCIKTIHEKRKAVYPLENGIALATVFPKNFVPAFYLRHERNYLFLWKQLLGLEAFYLSEEDTYLLNQIFAAELLKERLGSDSFQICLVKITQIHLLCALLEGNLILFKGSGSLSPDTLTLIRLFLSQLPTTINY